MERTAALLNAVAALVGTVIWPGVVLVIAFLFRDALRSVLTTSREMALTGPSGITFTAKRSDEATRALLRASVVKSRGHWVSGLLGQRSARYQVERIAEVVARLGRSPRVLWVDDRPSNNRYERAALEALGLTVHLSTSTEDALQRLTPGRYDLVISDMGRPPDKRAGYTLLTALREGGDETPFVIYAASRKAQHFDQAVAHGAVGCTNLPRELTEMVLRGLSTEQDAATAGTQPQSHDGPSSVAGATSEPGAPAAAQPGHVSGYKSEVTVPT